MQTFVPVLIGLGLNTLRIVFFVKPQVFFIIAMSVYREVAISCEFVIYISVLLIDFAADGINFISRIAHYQNAAAAGASSIHPASSCRGAAAAGQSSVRAVAVIAHARS